MTTPRKPSRHEEEEEHGNHERWLITYADMVTLLMVLFIVMFAMSQVDQKKFMALKEGLAGFVTVDDGKIAAALRLLLRTTHNLAEGAGAAGLAGLFALRDELAGRTVAIVVSGGNIDQETLRRVLNREIA